MTTDQKAQLATELLNAFTPSLIASFIFGLIVGVFFFSNLMTRLDRLSELYRRPKRIRFANLNGQIERNSDFEYLYFYQGRYYTNDQYQFLKREQKSRLKQGS